MLIPKIRSFLLIRLRHCFLKAVRRKKITNSWQKNNKRFERYKKLRRITDYEKIKEKANIKYNCDCGGRYANGSKTKHFRCIKHQKYINLLSSPSEEY